MLINILLIASVAAQSLDCAAECFTVDDAANSCSGIYAESVLEDHCDCTIGYKYAVPDCAACLNANGNTTLADQVISDAAALQDCTVINFFATGANLSSTVTEVDGVSCADSASILSSAIASCQNAASLSDTQPYYNIGNCLLQADMNYQSLVDATFAQVQCGAGGTNNTFASGTLGITTARLAVRLQRMYIDAVNAGTSVVSTPTPVVLGGQSTPTSQSSQASQSGQAKQSSQSVHTSTSRSSSSIRATSASASTTPQVTFASSMTPTSGASRLTFSFLALFI